MNDEHYQVLFDAWSESRLTPAEATELSAHLRTDPEARARFREAASFH
jgi:anti-sigma factor RsiW